MNSLESFVKFIPNATNPSLTITQSPVLTDMESKARKFGDGLTDSFYENSNEPSLGLYRIQVSYKSKNFTAEIEQIILIHFKRNMLERLYQI